MSGCGEEGRPLTVEELRLDTEELLLSTRSSEGPGAGASSPFSTILDAAWTWGGRVSGAPCFPRPAPTALGRTARSPLSLRSGSCGPPRAAPPTWAGRGSSSPAGGSGSGPASSS